MLAFSEILKSFSPLKNAFSKGSNVKKAIIEKIIDLILIFISIYLALNVEGWAEKKHEKDKEKVYLTNISKELQADIDNLKDVDKSTKEQQVKIKNIMFIVKNDKAGARDSFLNFFSEKLLNFTLFNNTKMTTYKSLIQSGEIKIIENMKIKENLTNIEDYYTAIKFYESLCLDFVKNQYTPAMCENYDLIKNKLVNQGIYENCKIRNMIPLVYSYNISRCEAYKTAIDFANKTKIIIDEELKKYN